MNEGKNSPIAKSSIAAETEMGELARIQIKLEALTDVARGVRASARDAGDRLLGKQAEGESDKVEQLKPGTNGEIEALSQEVDELGEIIHQTANYVHRLISI